MIRINLLPVRVSKREAAVRRELAVGGIGLAGILLVVGSFQMLLQGKLADVRAKNAQIQQEIDNLKQVVARVDEVDVLRQELQKKLDVIGALKQAKTGPVHMLDEISVATPTKLTLSGIREDSRRLSITGYAVSNEVISQFLSNMELSDWFDEVYLIEIDQEEQDGYKLKTFAITARLIVPGEDLSESEEEEAPEEKGRRGRRK